MVPAPAVVNSFLGHDTSALNYVVRVHAGTACAVSGPPCEDGPRDQPPRTPTRSSRRSTRSSARSPRPSPARCACWPAPAPARPGRSPPGSPTASPPATYVPQRVLAVTFTARAAGEMRTRLRALGAGGVQARTFHAAALRQLRYFWPRHVGGELPPLVEHKAALVAEAAVPGPAGHRPGHRPRPGRRGRVGQGHHDRQGRLPRGGREGGSHRAGRADPGGRGPAADGVRPGEARAARHRLRGRPALHGRADRRAPAGRRRGARAVPAPGGRRVPGRQPAAAGAARPVARRQRRGVRGRRPAPDDLHLRRRVARLPARLPGAAPRRPGGAAGPRLPLDAAGGRPGQPAGRQGSPRAARPARAGRAAPPGPGARPARAARRAGRGRLGRRAGQGPGGRGDRRRARSPCCSAPTARARPTSRRWPTPASPTSCAAASGSSTGPRCARPGCCCAGRPAPPTTPRAPTCRPRCGRSSPAAAGPRSRPRVAARSATGGSRWRRWPGWPTTWRRSGPEATLRDFVAELDERADAQHAPTVDGVTLASLHAAKGLEWDAVFLVGVTDGMIPITYAETPEQVEEERRLLYVGVTRAREHLAVTWSLSRSPGGRGSRRPVAVPRRPARGALRRARRPRAARGSARARRSAGCAARR